MSLTMPTKFYRSMEKTIALHGRPRGIRSKSKYKHVNYVKQKWVARIGVHVGRGRKQKVLVKQLGRADTEREAAGLVAGHLGQSIQSLLRRPEARRAEDTGPPVYEGVFKLGGKHHHGDKVWVAQVTCPAAHNMLRQKQIGHYTTQRAAAQAVAERRTRDTGEKCTLRDIRLFNIFWEPSLETVCFCCVCCGSGI